MFYIKHIKFINHKEKAIIVILNKENNKSVVIITDSNFKKELKKIQIPYYSFTTNFKKELKSKVNTCFNELNLEEQEQKELYNKIDNLLNKLEDDINNNVTAETRLKEYDNENLKNIINNYFEESDKKGLTQSNKLCFEQYMQDDENIYLEIRQNGAKLKKIAKMAFKEIEIKNDILGLFEDNYTIHYWDDVFKCDRIIENKTRKEVITELKNGQTFLDPKDVEDIFNKYKFYGFGTDRVKTSREVFKKGFFIIDGKLEENVDLSKDKYINEDVKIAIETLNNILECSKEAAQNNAVVYRFMLHSPFHFCIKQLGRANNNLKGLILHGEQDTGKSTTFKIGQWFYHPIIPKTPNTTDTIAAFGRVLEIDTFPSLFDDSYNLLKIDGMNQTLKSSIIDIISRTVTNNETGGLNSFIALSTPVFTFNENYEVKDGSIRRLDVHYYDSNMIMKKEDKDSFTDKYNPESSDSFLICLNALGYAFKEKIKPYLENNDTEVNDIDKLTIELLKEIGDEVGVELNPYLLKESERDDSLDEDIPAKLKRALNKEFRKEIRKIDYGELEYCRDDIEHSINIGVFDWLRYQKSDTENFIIDIPKFTKYCSKLINKILSWEDIKKYLRLYIEEDPKQIKASDKSKKPKNVNIGVRIPYLQLSRNVFGIKLDEDEIDLDDF